MSRRLYAGLCLDLTQLTMKINVLSSVKKHLYFLGFFILKDPDRRLSRFLMAHFIWRKNLKGTRALLARVTVLLAPRPPTGPRLIF